MENHSFDRLLRAAHTGRDPRVTTPDCLDAETLAAWMSDQLAAPQRAHAEAHVAGCARCQSMLAMMARAEEASGHVEGAPPRARFWRMLPWAVPLTAAATAAALWLAVRPNLVQPVRNVPTNAAVAQRELASAAASARPAEPSPTVPGERAAGASSSEAKAEGALRRMPSETDRLNEQRQLARADVEEREERKDALAEFRKQAKPLDDLQAGAKLAAEPTSTITSQGTSPGSRPAPPPAAPAPAKVVVPSAAQQDAALPRAGFAGGAAAQESLLLAPVVIVSPDPKVLWRIASGTMVQQSTDGGATWTTQSTGPAAFLTAGAAPAPTVCWIVGRAGTVLQTTDGRTWRRVTFPEPVDLIAVRATSADEATITAADRRTFSTKDGGKTWEDRVP
ncbi:MAG TPA: YCF48-related protein [Vicinamibacterales bacterium]|nr:YCF48-related protein [Vicinamibacterales bacterium]